MKACNNDTVYYLKYRNEFLNYLINLEEDQKPELIYDESPKDPLTADNCGPIQQFSLMNQRIFVQQKGDLSKKKTYLEIVITQRNSPHPVETRDYYETFVHSDFYYVVRELVEECLISAYSK